MKGLKHLLVDLDGTLLGSRDLPLRISFIFAVAREIRKHEPQIGFFRSLRALHAMRMTLESAGGADCNDIRASEAFGRALGLGEDRARVLLRDVVKTAFPTLKPHFFPIPGAAQFLEWARSRFSVHLATNPVWPREIVELRLLWAGIDPKTFQFISHAELMHACKPSLDYYRELLDRLSARASECLMIGDSARKDLPAAEIGIPVYLLGKEVSASKTGERVWRGNFAALQSFLENS